VIRKYSFGFIIILGFTLNLPGQVRCGFIGGVNISEISSDEFTLPNMSSSTLGSFGGVFDITLNRGLSLYLVPVYIEKGAKFAIDNPEEVSANLNMFFFELPVFLKYSIGKIFRPYVFGGPTLAVNISSNIETRIAGFVMEIDASDMTNNLEIGLTVGSGLSYATDAVTLFFEGRYSIGLTDISNSGSNSVSLFNEEFENVSVELPELTTSGFQLLIGFSLPFNATE
jgi:hypothetical protein